MSNEQLENFEELGRRAVACKHWRWMEGMKVVFPPVHEGDTGFCKRLSYDDYNLVDMEYPDLSDPATLGCLLALVREVHGDPRMFVETYSFLRDEWRCRGVWFSSEWDATSEAAALVAALEGAP